MNKFDYKYHLDSWESLVTPYEQTRAGFIALALEKNRKATPYVEEAKALKALTSKLQRPIDLLELSEIKPALLTASGISDKAANHLTDDDKVKAIKGLIENFLDPAGIDFIDELIYRFLLTRGDSLGGKIRNIAGVLGERKFSRALIATLSIKGRKYYWLHSKSKKWILGNKNDADIEIDLKGISWKKNKKHRILVYNLRVPIVEKNVDACLFDASQDQFMVTNKKSCHHNPSSYIALGELKAGIDPAGADEHWKTAKSALDRIRTSFSKQDLSPEIFFIGAAIERSMAIEIYSQLESRHMTNACNLTDDEQLISVCNWLINL